MTYPAQQPGFAGTFNAAQFALLNPATYTGQWLHVDDGTRLTPYRSTGAEWLPTDLTAAQIAAGATGVAGVTGGAAWWSALPNAVAPATFDDDGIDAAVARIVATGQPGVVLYPAGQFTIARNHPLVSGVSHIGVPHVLQFGPSDNVPDFWTMGSGGTVFSVAAGVTAFSWNATDQGSVQSPLMSFALKQCHIYGIAFNGGERAIKIGAVNAMGCIDGSIDMVYAYNQTCTDGGYAIDVQNSQFFHHGRIRVSNDASDSIGGNYRTASTLPGATLLPGDSHVNEIFSRVTSRTRKGVVFEATGATAATLNDMKVIGRIHSSRYTTTTPATVSMAATSGNANILISDAAQFALCTVGMPIRWQTTAPTTFDAVATYFVISRNTGAQTVQLAEADYGSAITPTSTGTFSTYVAGYPTFIARAESGCSVKNSNLGDLACEVTGNIGAVMFSKTRNCNANLNNPSTSFTGTSVLCRDAEIGITYSGASNVTMDESALTSGLCNLVNLAGGAYQYSGGSFTLDSSWHGRKVRYSGTADITITIPRRLPRGFYMELITTGATGIVTFSPASGLGLWSRISGFRTLGQYSKATLMNVSSLGYHLYGDLQV